MIYHSAELKPDALRAAAEIGLTSPAAHGAPIGSRVFAGLVQGSQVAANFGDAQRAPNRARQRLREAGLLPEPDLRSPSKERVPELRVLGRLPLKNEAARSGGRRPRSLGGGNRGPAWRIGAAPAAYLWGFEIGA